jgi:hypothetical protein
LALRLRTRKSIREERRRPALWLGTSTPIQEKEEEKEEEAFVCVNVLFSFLSWTWAALAEADGLDSSWIGDSGRLILPVKK